MGTTKLGPVPWDPWCRPKVHLSPLGPRFRRCSRSSCQRVMGRVEVFAAAFGGVVLRCETPAPAARHAAAVRLLPKYSIAPCAGTTGCGGRSPSQEVEELESYWCEAATATRSVRKRSPWLQLRAAVSDGRPHSPGRQPRPPPPPPAPPETPGTPHPPVPPRPASCPLPPHPSRPFPPLAVLTPLPGPVLQSFAPSLSPRGHGEMVSAERFSRCCVRRFSPGRGVHHRPGPEPAAFLRESPLVSRSVPAGPLRPECHQRLLPRWRSPHRWATGLCHRTPLYQNRAGALNLTWRFCLKCSCSKASSAGWSWN